MRIGFYLNGRHRAIDTDSGTPLSGILEMTADDSDRADTFIAASGCGEGKCGRCLVIIDGEVLHSCLIPGFSIRNKNITTFSGFRKTKDYEYIRDGFKEAGYDPCRLCLPGRVLTAHTLLKRHTIPGDEQILEGFEVVKCHCSGYTPFHEGVKTAARIRRMYE